MSQSTKKTLSKCIVGWDSDVIVGTLELQIWLSIMIHVAKTNVVKKETVLILLPVFQTETGDRWLISATLLLRHPESKIISEK